VEGASAVASPLKDRWPLWYIKSPEIKIERVKRHERVEPFLFVITCISPTLVTCLSGGAIPS
jgi:hypothetical protein